MNKNSNPLCPGCRKRTRSLGSCTRHPDPDGSRDMYECWTEDCPYMGVEALPHHWEFFRRQTAIMKALSELSEAQDKFLGLEQALKHLPEKAPSADYKFQGWIEIHDKYREAKKSLYKARSILERKVKLATKAVAS